uniref:Uncharacterized protein n=1 Tax=Panagrolaimus superbus TaxID=310955 RepID=A0A914Z9L7_9BILA
MNIFDEIKGDRYYIRKRMIKSRQKGGDLVVKYVKNAPNLTWKIEFNEELINRYSNKVAASTFVEVNGDEEGEESFTVRIDDEFDEDLVEDIIAGNLPDEFIDLLQVEESNDEESDNEN